MLDPNRYHVVFFDQRGCGRSRPLAREPDADLTYNTTQHLVGDIERLRELMGADRWAVLGVSWGTTLGMAYAETHPDRITGIVLALVGLTTKREVRWITEGGGKDLRPGVGAIRIVVPDHLAGIPLVDAYARLLFDPDPAVQLEAAKNWCMWEVTS